MKLAYMQAVTVLPLKAKRHLFGVFDEQAVSILAVLLQEKATFGELVEETRLSRASLSRVLGRLVRSRIVERTDQGYAATQRGRRITLMILGIAEEESEKAMDRITERLSQMDQDYRNNGCVLHSEARWERTREKPLIEVMAVHDMSGAESLLFQQRFQEEALHEEKWLRRSPQAR